MGLVEESCKQTLFSGLTKTDFISIMSVFNILEYDTKCYNYRLTTHAGIFVLEIRMTFNLE